MPSHANSNPDVKQLFINGHFCYVFKFGLITNGLGIVRHIEMYNKSYFAAHTEIPVSKKTDSPDEDKSVHDAKLLIPTLTDFFKGHPLINPHSFLGDAAFDSALLYRQLLADDTFGPGRHFEHAYIPLNKRSSITSKDYVLNSDGIPCCPHDNSLAMKYECSDIKTNGLKRYKFVCPRMKKVCDKTTGKFHRQCFCDNPCTPSRCGRMIHKSSTTSSTGGLALALKRAMLLLVQKDGYRKQFSLVRYKAVPLDSSFLVSSACSFIYF